MSLTLRVAAAEVLRAVRFFAVDVVSASLVEAGDFRLVVLVLVAAVLVAVVLAPEGAVVSLFSLVVITESSFFARVLAAEVLRAGERLAVVFLATVCGLEAGVAADFFTRVAVVRGDVVFDEVLEDFDAAVVLRFGEVLEADRVGASTADCSEVVVALVLVAAVLAVERLAAVDDARVDGLRLRAVVADPSDVPAGVIVSD